MTSAPGYGPPARGIRGSLGFWILLGLVLIPIIGFFYYMIATSLKTPLDITSPTFKWVFEPTLANYENAFARNDFGAFFINSTIVAVGSTALALLLGVPAAYVIAKGQRLRWAGVILASRITPGIAFLIPWFILFRSLGWIDTYQGLIAAHLTINLPLVIWLMVGYFEGLPRELLDASLVDGATETTTFRRIALPLARSGMAASGILAFIYSWNNFLFSVVLAGRNTSTLPVAVFNFMSYGSLNWGAIAAGATIMTLPVLVLVLVAQRQILEGLTAGWYR
jgi:multiple sugar transport system permease protein